MREAERGRCAGVFVELLCETSVSLDAAVYRDVVPSRNGRCFANPSRGGAVGRASGQASDPVSLSVIRARARKDARPLFMAWAFFFFFTFVILSPLSAMLARPSFGAAGNCYRCPVIIGPLWPSRGGMCDEVDSGRPVVHPDTV